MPLFLSRDRSYPSISPARAPAARRTIRNFHLGPAGCNADKRDFDGAVYIIERCIVHRERRLPVQFELVRQEFTRSTATAQEGRQ